MENDFDLQDIMLEAVAEVQEIIRELMTDLGAARAKGQLAQSWATAPEEMKDQFANERPADYAELMNTLEERQA